MFVAFLGKLLSLVFSLLKLLSRPNLITLSQLDQLRKKKKKERGNYQCHFQQILLYILPQKREMWGPQVWSDHVVCLSQSKESVWLKFVCEGSSMGGTRWASGLIATTLRCSQQLWMSCCNPITLSGFVINFEDVGLIYYLAISSEACKLSCQFYMKSQW